MEFWELLITVRGLWYIVVVVVVVVVVVITAVGFERNILKCYTPLL